MADPDASLPTARIYSIDDGAYIDIHNQTHFYIGLTATEAVRLVDMSSAPSPSPSSPSSSPHTDVVVSLYNLAKRSRAHWIFPHASFPCLVDDEEVVDSAPLHDGTIIKVADRYFRYNVYHPIITEDLVTAEDLSDYMNSLDLDLDFSSLSSDWCVVKMPTLAEELVQNLTTVDQIGNLAASYISQQVVLHTDAAFTATELDQVFQSTTHIAALDPSLLMKFIVTYNERQEPHKHEARPRKFRRFGRRSSASARRRESLRSDRAVVGMGAGGEEAGAPPCLHQPVIELLTETLRVSLEPIETTTLWLKLLSIFSQYTCNLDHLLAWQVTPVVLGAMAVYTDDAAVQMYACALLMALAAYTPVPGTKGPVRESAVELVVRALINHPYDIPVVIPAMATIAILTSTYARLIRNLAGCGPLISTVEDTLRRASGLLEYIHRTALPVLEDVRRRHTDNEQVQQQHRSIVKCFPHHQLRENQPENSSLLRDIKHAVVQSWDTYALPDLIDDEGNDKCESEERRKRKISAHEQFNFTHRDSEDEGPDHQETSASLKHQEPISSSGSDPAHQMTHQVVSNDVQKQSTAHTLDTQVAAEPSAVQNTTEVDGDLYSIINPNDLDIEDYEVIGRVLEQTLQVPACVLSTRDSNRSSVNGNIRNSLAVALAYQEDRNTESVYETIEAPHISTRTPQHNPLDITASPASTTTNKLPADETSSKGLSLRHPADVEVPQKTVGDCSRDRVVMRRGQHQFTSKDSGDVYTKPNKKTDSDANSHRKQAAEPSAVLHEHPPDIPPALPRRTPRRRATDGSRSNSKQDNDRNLQTNMIETSQKTNITAPASASCVENSASGQQDNVNSEASRKVGFSPHVTKRYVSDYGDISEYGSLCHYEASSSSSSTSTSSNSSSISSSCVSSSSDSEYYSDAEGSFTVNNSNMQAGDEKTCRAVDGVTPISYSKSHDNQQQDRRAAGRRGDQQAVSREEMTAPACGSTAAAIHTEYERIKNDSSKQKTHDSSKQKTHDSSKQKTHDSSKQKTHDSSKQKTHDSSKQKTHDSSKQKTHDSSMKLCDNHQTIRDSSAIAHTNTTETQSHHHSDAAAHSDDSDDNANVVDNWVDRFTIYHDDDEDDNRDDDDACDNDRDSDCEMPSAEFDELIDEISHSHGAICEALDCNAQIIGEFASQWQHNPFAAVQLIGDQMHDLSVGVTLLQTCMRSTSSPEVLMRGVQVAANVLDKGLHPYTADALCACLSEVCNGVLKDDICSGWGFFTLRKLHTVTSALLSNESDGSCVPGIKELNRIMEDVVIVKK